MPSLSSQFDKAQFDVITGLGDKAVSSDCIMLIDGHEALSLLIKQFSSPISSTAGEIETYGPFGLKMWQRQRQETAYTSSVQVQETVRGAARAAMALIDEKRYVDCTIYEGGGPTNFTAAIKLKKCFFKLDPAERDHESRGQVVMYSGSIFYHFFGDVIYGAGISPVAVANSVLNGLFGKR